jgi:hypothetical protein
MAEKIAISALVKKRAELSGELAVHDGKRKAILDRLANVDSVLAVFGYEQDPAVIKPRRKAATRIFKRGMLRRTVADIARQRPDLLDNRAIAVEVILRMGWDLAAAGLVAQIRDKVKDVRKVRRV